MPFRSLITYVHGIVFLTFLFTKTSSDKFGVYRQIFMQQQILFRYVSNTFQYHYLLTIFLTELLNSRHLSTHILFAFLLDSFKVVSKALVIVIPFFTFKGTNQAYLLLQVSITHNKNLNPLLNFFINCLSAESAPQIFL